MIAQVRAERRLLRVASLAMEHRLTSRPQLAIPVIEILGH
ncbi:MAG: hypothetical protein ACI9HK_003380 [Pirellulaceae bacterium]|jgi:hypothetical protein